MSADKLSKQCFCCWSFGSRSLGYCEKLLIELLISRVARCADIGVWSVGVRKKTWLVGWYVSGAFDINKVLDSTYFFSWWNVIVTDSGVLSRRNAWGRHSHWWKAVGMHGNDVLTVKVFTNALWTALRTIFRPKMHRIPRFRIAKLNIFRRPPPAPTPGRDRQSPCAAVTQADAWTQAPSSAWLACVPTVPVLRNDHCTNCKVFGICSGWIKSSQALSGTVVVHFLWYAASALLDSTEWRTLVATEKGENVNLHSTVKYGTWCDA